MKHFDYKKHLKILFGLLFFAFLLEMDWTTTESGFSACMEHQQTEAAAHACIDRVAMRAVDASF